MAGKKLTEETVCPTPLDGTELFRTVKSGFNYKVSLSTLVDYISGLLAPDPPFQFPIGFIFISATSDDPATVLGYGTWARFGQGRCLFSQDSGDTDFDTGTETGGAKSVTPAGTVSQPTFTGDALATHTHTAGTLLPNAHSGAAVANHAAHTHSYSDVINHTHTINVTDGGHNHTQNSHNHTQDAHTHTQNSHFHTYKSQTATTGSETTYEHGTVDTSSTGTAEGGVTEAATATNQNATATNQAATAVNQSATTGITASSSNPAGGVASGTTGNPSATLTHSVTQPSDHTMSGSTASQSAGTPSGTVSQPTFTGSEVSTLPPYIVVFMWRRTA